MMRLLPGLLSILCVFELLFGPAALAQTSESQPDVQGSKVLSIKDLNRPIRDKWALVVGIGEFANDKVPKLKYATKDAKDFYNYLTKEAHFAPDHVRLLLNSDATQRRILSELGSKFLARLAKPDDLIVLFFSTHGSPSQLDIRGKNYIVAYDTEPEELFASGIEMQKILDSIKGRVLTDRVLMVLDACHSGNVNPNAKGMHRVGNFDAQSLAQGSGQMVICSSSPEQRSWESKRYDNGIFTRQLLAGLRTKGGDTTIGDAFNQLERHVQTEVSEDYPGMRQTPVLHSKWEGANLLIAARPAAPQTVPDSVVRELQPDSTKASVGGSRALYSSSLVTDNSDDRVTVDDLRSKKSIILTQTSFWDGPNPTKAYEDACRMVSTNFNDPEYYYKKAVILIRLGKWGKAMSTLKNIISEKGNDYRFYLAIGYCFHRMGQEGRALDNLEKAKFHNPLLPTDISFGD